MAEKSVTSHGLIIFKTNLRLLEEDEARLSSIRSALIEGEESGVSENFDPATFVETLNAAYEAEGR